MTMTIYGSKQRLGRLLTTLITALAAALLLTAAADAELMDRVVAEVNGEIITLSELERDMAAIGEDFLHDVPPEQHREVREDARRQVLSGMIDRLLVQQQAARRGIFVGESEMDAAVEQIMADNRLSREEFIDELAQAGITLEDYRRDLRAQILQSRLLSVEVRERIVIPESRIRRYYEENYADGKGRESYHLLQMGFNWQQGNEQARQEARQRAAQARTRIMAGEDFSTLAREVSELPSANRGGDLGVFAKDELSPLLQRHITELKPGELTPVLETGDAYQIFKLVAGGDLSELGYEDFKQEIREKLYHQSLEERFDRWVESLRQDAYIRVMLQDGAGR